MAIHTIELTSCALKRRQYAHCITRIHKLVNAHRCSVIESSYYKFGFILSGFDGIKIMSYRKKIPHITLIINPSILLGGTYSDLCEMTRTNFEYCASIIDNLLDEIQLDMVCDEFTLKRIDCTVDIDFPCVGGIPEFIRCVQHTNLPSEYRVHKFNAKYENYKELNRHSFRAACQDITLSIYDKSFQLAEWKLMTEDEIPSNRLRLEMSIQNHAFQRLFDSYSRRFGKGISYDPLKEKISWFSEMSVLMLRNCFAQTLTPGEYLSPNLAAQMIEGSRYSPKIKDRMFSFLRKVSTCYTAGIAGAIRAFKKQGYSADQINYMLKCFQEIGLNPATIRLDSGFECFPSISELLNVNALPASVQ